MTDNEIIKALECCADEYIHSCDYCPFEKECYGDNLNLVKYALDLINRLQADKEALIARQETLQKALAAKIAESEKQSQNFKVLVSDHRTLQQSFDNLKDLYEEEKAKVEIAKEKCIGFAKELQTAKAELKETTEKFNCQQYVYTDLSNIIREKNAEIERLNKASEKDFEAIAVSTVDRHQKWIKRRAIKEFADKVKASRQKLFFSVTAFDKQIDNLVKEMVGDTE